MTERKGRRGRRRGGGGWKSGEEKTKRRGRDERKERVIQEDAKCERMEQRRNTERERERVRREERGGKGDSVSPEPTLNRRSNGGHTLEENGKRIAGSVDRRLGNTPG